MGQVWSIDDWNGIIQQVNVLAANPDPGCDPVLALSEVTAPHIWKGADVTAVRGKLLEICTDNVFIVSLEYWKQDIIDEINTAIAVGWCGCEEECLPECSNAQGDVVTYCGTITSVGCEAIGPETGCTQAARDQVTEAGNEAAVKIGLWADAWTAYCDLSDAVDSLQGELDALEAIRDVICASGPPAECAAAQAAVDAKQGELNAATEARDDKLIEANGYEADAEVAAASSTSLANSIPSCSSTTPLSPFIAAAPWADYACNQLGPECLGRDPRRCRPSWNLQRRTTTHFWFGGTFVGSWGVELSGGYTKIGTPYITYVRACVNQCNYACASNDCEHAVCNWYEHEYRLSQSFPYPTGEECCD
jgi:hypothetical protein